MVYVGNNSVIRILSFADLSRPVANPRAVRKVQPHLLAPAGGRASRTRVNVRINADGSVARGGCAFNNWSVHRRSESFHSAVMLFRFPRNRTDD